MKIGPPRSLLGQFFALHLVIALIAAIALPTGVARLLHKTADHYQHNLLRQQAAIVARWLGDSDHIPPVFHPEGLIDGMAFAVIGSDRRVKTTQGEARGAVIIGAPIGPKPIFFRRDTVEALSKPAARGRWIIVSQDAAAPEVLTDDIVTAFLDRFALLLLPIAALVPLVGTLLTWRLTRRMKAVSAIAAGIGPRTLDTRLPRDTLPLEVEPLAAATNEALDRLEAGFRAQASFAADVAHELRTPLAVVRLRADAVQDEAVRIAMLASVDRAARVVTQLMELAHLEQPIEESGEIVDLHALATTVIADRAPGILAGKRRIALENRGGGTAIPGSSTSILLALENLVDNATRHTPPGTSILITVGPGARLSVSDDGDGVPAEQLARLKQRFWRADNSPPGGIGVGLSIVERVAIAHQGSLVISAGPRGRGLLFELQLG